MNAKVESLHRPAEFVHRDEREWETIRWPGQTGKMLFHPRPERPTEPNAGHRPLRAGRPAPAASPRVRPGLVHPRGRVPHRPEDVRPGTMVFYPDPHYEDELFTETGGEMLFVQYPGPTTGGKPIYDGRFNMKERKSVEDERTDR